MPFPASSVGGGVSPLDAGLGGADGTDQFCSRQYETPGSISQSLAREGFYGSATMEVSCSWGAENKIFLESNVCVPT